MMLYMCRGIQIDKVDSISKKYQIMVISMLKSWSHKYSINYIIKFVSFIQILYVINLDIVLPLTIFSNLYIESITLL